MMLRVFADTVPHTRQCQWGHAFACEHAMSGTWPLLVCGEGSSCDVH